jgi:predicted NAD/FAD-dependent oxidoreductase
VVGFEWEQGAWSVRTEADDLYHGEVLILTPPVPQSLDLLQVSGLDLEPELVQRLESVSYEPCIAVLALLNGTSQIPEPGGLWLAGNPIAWIADNQKKAISPQAAAITIHAGAAFSRAHWEADETAVVGQLLDAARPWLGREPIQTQVHRWRYAKPVTFYGEASLRLNGPGPLLLTGDAMVGPRIEGAFLAGLAASSELVSGLRDRR